MLPTSWLTCMRKIYQSHSLNGYMCYSEWCRGGEAAYNHYASEGSLSCEIPTSILYGHLGCAGGFTVHEDLGLSNSLSLKLSP